MSLLIKRRLIKEARSLLSQKKKMQRRGVIALIKKIMRMMKTTIKKMKKIMAMKKKMERWTMKRRRKSPKR